MQLPGSPALLSAVSLAIAQAQETPLGAQFTETPENWFVEPPRPPLAGGGSPAGVRNDKQSFRAAAQRAGIRFRERFAYDNLFNGLSIEVSRSDLGKLSLFDDVRTIFPAATMAAPETRVAGW